jgi:Na+/proline symporter
MRSIKTLAASLLLAVMVSMSAQTALAGIIITDNRADTVQPPVKSQEALDSTGIYISTLVNIGIIITGGVR